MLMKQISVFIENHKGKLSEVTEVLKKEDIDIRALMLSDATDYGILRLIVNAPDTALELLKESGFTVSLTNVLAVCVPDQPGGLHGIFALLKEEGVSVEYCYALVSHATGEAHVIMRVDKTEVALQRLQQAKYQFLQI